jgi:8-oxo-dGTP pyrophosphatase MutT (NUDIX family)
MAQSTLPTHQYPSPSFVESCGAILFDLTHPATPRICIANLLSQNQYVLPKGRRNINESRKDAALREMYEETGYRCKLLPVTMATRATAPDDDADVVDEARVHERLTEPFMSTVRELANAGGVKIIWWFIAVLDEEHGQRGPGERSMKAEFFDWEEALEKLWYKTDREIVRRAMDILQQSVTGAGLDGARS